MDPGIYRTNEKKIENNKLIKTIKRNRTFSINGIL